MKLNPDEVALIVKKILEEWKRQDLTKFKITDLELTNRLNEIFLADLRVEDDLNREVETMLGKYENQFQSGALDRRKMFLMVKAQLVKERRLVL
ncbi:MAG: DUF507 family protein [Pseudomonadota bacterium]